MPPHLNVDSYRLYEAMKLLREQIHSTTLSGEQVYRTGADCAYDTTQTYYYTIIRAYAAPLIQ